MRQAGCIVMKTKDASTKIANLIGQGHDHISQIVDMQFNFSFSSLPSSMDHTEKEHI